VSKDTPKRKSLQPFTFNFDLWGEGLKTSPRGLSKTTGDITLPTEVTAPLKEKFRSKMESRSKSGGVSSMLKARMTGRTKKKHAENRSNTAPPTLPIIILGGEADEEGDSNDLHHQQQHIQPQHTQPQHLRSLHESNFEENETEFLEETRLKQARRLLKQASKCLYASQERNPLSPFSSLLWGDIWKDLAETWTSWKKIDKCFQTAYTKYETTLATSGPAKVQYTTPLHFSLQHYNTTLHVLHHCAVYNTTYTLRCCSLFGLKRSNGMLVRLRGQATWIQQKNSMKNMVRRLDITL